MKISRAWLQKYFEQPLPDAAALAEALTFHAFEIESVVNDVLDVKVTPNRGHDCLCHRGIAKELSAILNVPMKSDPLREPVSLEPRTEAVQVDIKEPALCARFTTAYITGLRVGPSPERLRAALESIGQRSINNVVDATNFVMFDLGQPLHAFDAGKLSDRDGSYALVVEKAEQGERLIALDGKEYDLNDTMLVIRDGHTALPVSIAGVKGGAPAAIDETTENIVLEAANWDGVNIRKTSQALKLRTDASSRFEQVISPELSAYGTLAAAKLIMELAGGTLVGFTDDYEREPQKREATVSLDRINRVLGTTLHESDVDDVFGRLQFAYQKRGSDYSIFVPFERLDLSIPEDIVEEVARIVGYDKVPTVELSAFPKKPAINRDFASAERVREEFINQGYSEVLTSVFAEKGDRVVANKVDGIRPYLRTNLTDGLVQSVKKNLQNKELLGLKTVKLFEIGTVWEKGKEEVHVATIVGEQKSSNPNVKGWNGTEVQLEGIPATVYSDFPISNAERYQPFSRYPFIVRDIAMWVPKDTSSFSDVVTIFGEYSQGLLRHVDLFDQFEKAGRVSYAFHLVFQSFDKTLTDTEVNAIMQKITEAVATKGFEVR